ncbi:MAG: helix-turn-helix transcriptional regulator [Firmicutes bacterium]|nr:helix-turn-helix transcriptional regulator [Bacillota bacterium]
MEFKERLHRLRKENKLTQNSLAQILNYGSTAISNYESGRNEPSISDIKKIARFFDVSIDYLLCASDERRPFGSKSRSGEIGFLTDAYFSLSKENKSHLLSYLNFLMKEQINLSGFSQNELMVAEPVSEYKTNEE